MPIRFVSEPIQPDRTSFETSCMAAGEPGLPLRFTWRGRSIGVVRLLSSWRRTGPCRHGSKERYVRRHWYMVEADTGTILTIYFERQSRSKGDRTRRWWLYTEETPEKEQIGPKTHHQGKGETP